MRQFYRALSLFWFLRAASRGPGALLRYLMRRQIRRAAYRTLDRAFRVSGLYGPRRRR
jgi:hypothetical protein